VWSVLLPFRQAHAVLLSDFWRYQRRTWQQQLRHDAYEDDCAAVFTQFWHILLCLQNLLAA
jgi:hypothetical protein